MSFTAKEPQVLTFGCRLNAYESEVMKGHARSAGLQNTIIVNTCAVTKEAERQAKQAIRRVRREHPEARIIVTGCAAQINPKSYADMNEVNQVIGNDVKLNSETWGLLVEDRVLVNDIMSVRETANHLISGYDDRTRAFLQVQNGCDHRCTFCIIPYGRGPSRSVPIGVITDQVRALVQSGYNELVFTGVDITSYGKDLPGAPTLGQMIRRVLALVPELPRLRLSSIDPAEIDDDMWRLIESEPRLMPHLHLSLQAGDDMILKRMKRRHLSADIRAVCERARTLRPDMAFGADIIAGFPTETEAMFENTMTIVEDCDITFLHVFPYSEREGTPAAKIPNQVPVPARKERAAQLRALGERQVQRFLQRHVGAERCVIIEKGNIGRTEHFAEVALNDSHEVGGLLHMRMNGIEGSKLTGTVLS